MLYEVITIPQAAIGLDVITGFPGENDEAFERTYGLIDALPVSHLHVFPYSRRPGTPAARMPQQVPPAVAKERAARLRTLGERKLEPFSRNFLGETRITSYNVCYTKLLRRGRADR